jgi:hypothetical protein
MARFLINLSKKLGGTKPWTSPSPLLPRFALLQFLSVPNIARNHKERDDWKESNQVIFEVKGDGRICVSWVTRYRYISYSARHAMQVPPYKYRFEDPNYVLVRHPYTVTWHGLHCDDHSTYYKGNLVPHSVSDIQTENLLAERNSCKGEWVSPCYLYNKYVNVHTCYIGPYKVVYPV